MACILVADDEEMVRRTLCGLFEFAGYETIEASGGEEAIRHYREALPDLVISDIKMPYRNGYEIFAAARRRQEEVPVVLMTGFGYDPDHAIVRASDEGLSCVLFKPFKVDQMLGEVHKALGLPTAPASAEDANAQDH